MSQIKSKNTKPEMLIRSVLSDLKIPHYSNYEKLVGKPDIYIPSLCLAIEIRGCFWHGHQGCRYFVMPKSNTEFWLKKINGNIARDKTVTRQLRIIGIKTFVIWECEVKDGSFFPKILDALNNCYKTTTQHL